MKQPSFAPHQPQACPEWAEPLNAIHRDDLSFEQRRALHHHLETCSRCQAIKAEYRTLDALLTSLPPVESFASMPERLQELVGVYEETEQLLPTGDPRDLFTLPLLTSPTRVPARRRRLSNLAVKLNMAAAVLMIAALVGGFLVLSTSHRFVSVGSQHSALYLFNSSTNIRQPDVASAVDTSTGSIIWQHDIHEDIIGNASLVAGGNIYHLSGDGNIYALNVSNGQPLWHTKLTPDQTPPATTMFSSKPVVSGNLVVVATTTGDLFALNVYTGAIVWQNHLPGCTHDGKWGPPNNDHSSSFEGTSCGIYTIEQASGALYGVVTSSDSHLAGLYSWDATNGQTRWYHPQYSTTYLRPMVVSHGKIYLPSAVTGIDVLDANSGHFLRNWQTRSPLKLAVNATTLYLLDENSQLSAYRLSDDTLLWKKLAIVPINGMSVTDNNIYLVFSNHQPSPAILYVLNASTGNQRWQWQGAQQYDSDSPIEINGIVCVSTADGIYALQFDTGDLLWHLPNTHTFEMIAG